ncbi:TPA: DUF2972 domain-containing protein [Campylobacter coli]|nr:DUF2972 domain-containing protein [Campylobacter coli]
MYNPNSAIERVKNHLAYKLGQAMIDFANSSSGGGYIALFKKLYKIKKQHKKEQKIYQQTIQVFPQLKYPSLEACSDYEQALKYKFHLSYMLGEVLIQTFQNLHKGSMFKLAKNIKKANKEFKIFKEIFNNFAKLSPNIIKIISKNKQAFLKELPRIQNILKIHQDYQPILDNIFHNFNYFIQNFNLIEEWLLSNDFNEKYKKENHPYPSLLDPKKLNDENEKINYKNIPAELAWEMNLPLPRNYRFIFITGGSCGHMAMFLYFKLLKINRNWTSETEKEKYKIAYNVFIASKEYNIFSCQWDKITQKLFYLVDFNVPLVVLLRDPIERLKSLTNHIVKHITKFDLTLNPNEALVNKYYKMKDYPSLEKVDTIVDYPNYFDIFSKITYFKNITEVFILDTKDIVGNRCYTTFCNLSKKLNFQYPSENLKEIFITPFVSKVMDMLPLTLVLYPTNQYDNKKDIFTHPIEIIITFRKMMLYCNQEKLIDMKKDFFSKSNWDIQDEILFLIDKNDKNRLLSDSCLFLQTQQYLRKFMIVFENKIKEEKKKLFSENDILNYLRDNKQVRIKLKNVLKHEINFTKKTNQKIVASWKYYQEFEQMCKELDDGDIYEKDL